jgi:hypothetical protein
MEFWLIRKIGTVSVLIAVLTLAGGLWQIFAPDSRLANYLPAPSGGAVWVTFLFIGLVALRVSATLKDQSLEIDTLKRRLDQVQLGK